ncbi:MAG: RdgB/HAM1 family non-canonical purine NTP pyrophosphatase [Chitinophagaceae bacterium]|nr:MAG: RdgB/HAM1 family non-canonical purine NTP pyrophosphatase [Chitinophagaceae bacterium]
MELIFATNNENKVKELNAVLDDKDIIVKSLAEAGITIDIPEPYETLEENARTKSETIYQLVQKNCFSEDTGLEIEALGGAPGVKSARFADGEPQYKDYIEKVLVLMGDTIHRKARFRTVISLILNGKETQFEGICNGSIAIKRSGNQGFGYDAIFIPDGRNQSFADMDLSEKKKISHRTKAVEQLVLFLKNINY